MPTVLRVKGFRFGFFSVDWKQPRHIHVSKQGCAAKFWLGPVRLVNNYGFRADELSDIVRILEDHEEEIKQSWDNYFRGTTNSSSA